MGNCVCFCLSIYVHACLVHSCIYWCMYVPLFVIGLLRELSKGSSDPTFSFVSSPSMTQIEQQKDRGHRVCACACIWICVCALRVGWRLREGGGVVGNRSILQMLQGRSKWKVLWLSVLQHSLTRKGMPHVASSQLGLKFTFAQPDRVIIAKFGETRRQGGIKKA